MDIPSPQSVRDVQKLTGRIATLSRFISRSAHRSYPFFQVLRKAQKFGWDEKCEQAFQDLKKHLAELPILAKPEPGEKLWIYLSATEFAIKLALRIDSKITNNEAEYEAVLVGLQAAREVGASRVIIYSDSQLVAQQIKGTYEAKNEKMLKYLGLITTQASPFFDWNIEQIPREENEEADILAKLACLHVGYKHPGSPLFHPWVEAEPLAKITEEEIMKFLWKNIVCKYGIPRKLISYNGRQFQGKKITTWCQEMKIIQSFTSVTYPQANGQTEVTNRIIVQALKARLHGKGKDWVEELPIVLWAYRTTPRSSTQETPYSLVYCSEAVLPVEIGQSSTRIESYLSNNDQS
ncbi:uncharacterized protein LOC142508094 [Primulina tabacum]|uniref:uncharacterized protein LOC142508094 n=1 Tax=Primulina tabacum TaxID=48773 RepID=UPI003F59B68A